MKVRRDTIEITDTIWLQPVGVECPEVIDNKDAFWGGFLVGAFATFTLGFLIFYPLTEPKNKI